MSFSTISSLTYWGIEIHQKNVGNYMEQIWKEMFQAAKAVQNGRQISDYVDAGEFQDKKNLLKLYKTLHPEDTDATEDTLDIVTIDNVLTWRNRKSI